MEQANLFELKNAQLKITFSASGLDGKPSLGYHKGATEMQFRGKQLRMRETEIGTLVSVTLKEVPDAYSSVFSLLIPQVNIPSGEGGVHVLVKGFETRVRSSIGGPNLVNGQVQTYKSVSLSGVAKSVVF